MSANPAHLYLDAPAVLVTPFEDLGLPLEDVAVLPGSKSLANRYIPLLALSDGGAAIEYLPRGAADVERMIEAVSALGAHARWYRPTGLYIEGVGGRWKPKSGGSATLDVGGSGTSIRFLAALSLLSPTPVTLTGDETLRARPVGQLADALEQIGARVEYTDNHGYPPFTVHPPRELPAETVTLSFGQLTSSQFISALMMVGVFLPGGLELRFDAPVPSWPYIEMTARVLRELRYDVSYKRDGFVCVRRGPQPSERFARLEPDASAATYLAGTAAATIDTFVKVQWLDPKKSKQGDVAFLDILRLMGARVAPQSDGVYIHWALKGLRGVKADLSDMPDTAMTLAAVATMAKGATAITGLKTLRVKETDRVAALEAELNKLGPIVTVTETADDVKMVIDPSKRVPLAEPPVFETYRDHRMAMSLALIGLREPGAIIKDPGCVAKTYPGFWTDFSKLANVQPVNA